MSCNVVSEVTWISVKRVDFTKFELRNRLTSCFHIYMEFYINYAKKPLCGCPIGYFSHARLNTVRSWLAQYRTLGLHQEIKNSRPNNGNSLTFFCVVARLEFNSLLIIVLSNDDHLGSGTWRFTPVEY